VKPVAEGRTEGGAAKRISNADVKRSYDGMTAALMDLSARIDCINPQEEEQIPAGGQAATTVVVPNAVNNELFITSREQFETYRKIIDRRDAEFADKQFMSLLEHICAMREDYRHLVANMEKNIETMTGSDVLSSFKGYLVDMDNMLKDAGVRYGSFETPNHAVDTNLQRIVGVVPTWDQTKDGTVAERLSSGYEYKGRAVVKEKVRIYRAKDGMETS